MLLSYRLLAQHSCLVFSSHLERHFHSSNACSIQVFCLLALPCHVTLHRLLIEVVVDVTPNRLHQGSPRASDKCQQTLRAAKRLKHHKLPLALQNIFGEELPLGLLKNTARQQPTCNRRCFCRVMAKRQLPRLCMSCENAALFNLNCHRRNQVQGRQDGTQVPSLVFPTKP